jgi:hypothetical protein
MRPEVQPFDPALPGERRHVAREVDRVRADLVRQPRQLVLRPAALHEEPSTALAQRRVEVGEALEHELGPGPARVTAMEEPVVDAEHGDDAVVLRQCRAQGGVVMHA